MYAFIVPQLGTLSNQERKPRKRLFPPDFYNGRRMVASRQQVVEYLFSQAKVVGECWFDAVGLVHSKYGHHNIWLAGHNVQLARLVLEETLGRELRPGYETGHMPVVCHNPQCIRPEHLYESSKQDQQRDMKLDGTNRLRGRVNHSSIYTGVCWREKRHKWRSMIWINGRNYFLGYHENEVDAAQAYLLAVVMWERCGKLPSEYLTRRRRGTNNRTTVTQAEAS